MWKETRNEIHVRGVYEIILFRNLCMKFDGIVLLVIFEYQSGFDRSKLEPIRGNRGFFCNVY